MVITNVPKVPSYLYRCSLIRVIDGDTVEIDLDLGCHTYVRKTIRFLGIDTEELRSSEAERRARAQAAKKYLTELLTAPNTTLVIETQIDSSDKYGRLLGRIYVNRLDECIDVTATLLAEGFAKQ